MEENTEEPRAPNKMSVGDLFEILKRYDNYISLANQKASYLLASTLIVLTAAVTNKTGIIAHTEFAVFTVGKYIISISWLNEALYIVGIIFLFVLSVFCLFVLFPITSACPKESKYTSLIAYSSVDIMTVDDYIEKLGDNEYDFIDDLSRQTHHLAKITNHKFRHVKWASRGAIVVLFCVLGLFTLMVFK